VQHVGIIYESTNPVGKNKMLKILCSNCTLLDGVLTVTYREPFVLFADFARQVQEKRTGSDLSEPGSNMWRD